MHINKSYLFKKKMITLILLLEDVLLLLDIEAISIPLQFLMDLEELAKGVLGMAFAFFGAIYLAEALMDYKKKKKKEKEDEIRRVNKSLLKPENGRAS